MAINVNGISSALSQAANIDGALSQRIRPSGDVGQVADGMGRILENAIAKLDGEQKAADAGIASLVADEPVDLHQVMLQMEQSMLSLNLALQVRNKIVEAYQEIQRMQV